MCMRCSRHRRPRLRQPPRPPRPHEAIPGLRIPIRRLSIRGVRKSRVRRLVRRRVILLVSVRLGVRDWAVRRCTPSNTPCNTPGHITHMARTRCRLRPGTHTTTPRKVTTRTTCTGNTSNILNIRNTLNTRTNNIRTFPRCTHRLCNRLPAPNPPNPVRPRPHPFRHLPAHPRPHRTRSLRSSPKRRTRPLNRARPRLLSMSLRRRLSPARRCVGPSGLVLPMATRLRLRVKSRRAPR